MSRTDGSALWEAAIGLCLLGAASCIVSACSAGRPRNPRDVSRLIAESPPPPGQRFEPLPPEERLALLDQGDDGTYRIGIGDVLEISENTKTVVAPGLSGLGSIRVKVKQDGNIYLPELGMIAAKDQTVVSLQAQLLEKLSAFNAKPFLSVAVVEYNSQKFYILGETAAAGRHAVDGTTTLLDAVGGGGGANRSADLQGAQVIRGGKILPIGLSDILVRGDLSRNIVMRDKDIVFVPSLEDKKVFVLGEVVRPGIVTMDRGRLSLLAAVASAGGIATTTADPNVVRIFRGTWSDLRCYTVSECELAKAGESIQLLPGDRVLVAPYRLATASRALGLVTPIISGVSDAILTPILVQDALKN